MGLLLACSLSLVAADPALAWSAKRQGRSSHKSDGGHHGHQGHGKHYGHHGHGRHHGGKHYRPYRYYYGYPSYWAWGYGGYGGYWGAPASRRGYARETETERGFRYLVEGDRKRAVSTFAKLAESRPDEALPKLGYAIAMSELGDVQLGVWAMRRAIRTDAGALLRPPVDPSLRPRIRALLDLYHPTNPDPTGPEPPHGDDAHFMVAALLWVLGDVAGASSATEWALADGDDHESTRVLARAIADSAPPRLEPHPGGAPVHFEPDAES